MPDVQAVGDQSNPAERRPLEESFEYTGIKEDDQDETAIDQREAKFVDPADGLEQARKRRPGVHVDIGIVAHRHEQEPQHTDAHSHGLSCCIQRVYFFLELELYI